MTSRKTENTKVGSNVGNEGNYGCVPYARVEVSDQSLCQDLRWIRHLGEKGVGDCGGNNYEINCYERKLKGPSDF